MSAEDRAGVPGNADATDVLQRWVRHGGTVHEVTRRSGLVRLELRACDGHEAMEHLVLEVRAWEAWQATHA